jgi:Flp pilus assembly protein TadD
MPANRLEALQGILRDNPSDALARYGLAMELAKAGQLEAAVAEFRALIALKPDHAYAYFHTGQTLEKLGRIEEARRMYQAGADRKSTRLNSSH